MSKSDYKKVRTNIYDLLPEVYKSGVSESTLETTLNRFLSKTDIQRKIGFVGQGNPNASINRQIQEPDAHRQAFQLQPLIYSQIGTIEHISSSKDILAEAERIGVDIDRMKEWGDAVSFNWAPPVDYDKIINFRDYYWENLDNLADSPQYITIQSPCTKASAKLDEYNNTKSQFGSEFNIVGLNAQEREIIIEGDLSLLFVEDFIFYIKNSTNTTINNEFFVTESSRQIPASDRTAIKIVSSSSPAFDDSIVDGIVSLEELTEVFQSEVDCVCSGSRGWDGGLWDDNQIGDVIWNAEIIQGSDVFQPGNIQFSTEANWITNNCSASPCPALYDIWHDTTNDTLNQYDGSMWVVVQNEFSTIVAKTTGQELWDLSQDCISDLNVWQQQNKWVHKNQVTNFTLAKQAQIPILEFLDTVQLNEWAETTYLWKYRASAVSDFQDTTVQPNIVELMGITNPASPARGAGTDPGFVIDSGLQEIVINAQYGDLTNLFVPGFEFRVIDDTLTPGNNQIFTVDSSLYCVETQNDKFQTRIRVVESFSSTTTNGTIVPNLTSVGDTYADLHVHWLFVGIDESKPTIRQPENPMVPIPINPPPASIDFTTTGSPPALVLGTYVKSLFAQVLSLTTSSFGTIPVAGVSGSPSVWTLSGNHATVINDPKFKISILEISGNTGGGANGQYTIVSAVDNGANTDITVAETIPGSATPDGNGFVHWTFRFDEDLHDQLRTGTNELRVYLNDVRQYGTYVEVNENPGSSPPIEICDDYVNEIIFQIPTEQFDAIRVEVGAAALSDIGYENVFVRTVENDLLFNPLQNLECVSLVKYRKLEQVKTITNQYPLFDLFSVEGDSVNRADRIFEFQESQDASINPNIGKRIVISDDGRTYFYEQSLLDEDNGIIFTYRDTGSSLARCFWYDNDNSILYFWDGNTWSPKINTQSFATSGASPIGLPCFLTPIVSDTPPGSPFIDIDGMIWFNTNDNSINISNGTAWVEDTLRSSLTIIAPSDPTLQSIWRTGPEDNKTIYVPTYVDENRSPLLHHAIVGVDTTGNTWTIYDGIRSTDRFDNDVILLREGDIISVNNNFDINSNGTYTVTELTENTETRTVVVGVQETIPGTATISGHMTRNGDAEGDWEVPEQLYFNYAHENRKVISSTDLLAHFLSIIENQVVPPGLFGDSTAQFHALTDINFGAGGKIKEYNGSYDTFISSIFVQTVNPLRLYEYAHDAYESSLNQIKEIYRRDVRIFMTDTSEEAVADLSGDIANDLIEEYEKNDFANFVYGDSNTYIQETDTGIRNWPATIPFTRLGKKIRPILLDDPKLSINGIRHHDGHISQVGFLSTTINQFALQIILTDDSRGTNPTGKMGIQASTLPPEDFSNYEAIFGKTSACYWYHITPQQRTLYRMTAVRISANSSPPAVSLPIGTYWYDTTNDRLKVLQDGSPGGPAWVNATTLVGKLTEGTVSAWEIIDINQILAESILELETRLFDAAPDLNELAFDISALETQNPDLFAKYEMEAFFEFVNQVGITEPFDNSDFYDEDNPFTWNYINSTPTINPPTQKVPFVPGGTWQDLYTKRYNTPYPHLEPWKIQSYTSKPDWWDGLYAVLDGTRRWTTTMWSNVLDGIVPSGEILPSGDVSTGATGEVQEYDYVSVNISSLTLTDDNGNLYDPDDMFPPLLQYPLSSTPFGVDSIFRDISEIVDPEDAYEYNDAGLVEWNWKNSSQFLYDQLKVSFRIQPVRFIQQTLGEEFVESGCLEISRDLEKVYAHQEARLHGDLLADNTVLSFPGTLQWYVNFNRFNGYDSSSSNFRPMWTNWRTFLSYQFATFVDTESFIVFNRNFDITTQDYSVRIKRSPGISDHWVEAFNATLIQAPPSSSRIDTESQWIFDVSTFNPIGRIVKYYAPQSYNFTVDTSTSPTEIFDTMTVNDIYGRDLPWVDGDEVIVKSTEFLPSPLLADTIYYVNIITPTSFSLSEQPGGPVIDILSTGSGTLTVANIARSFRALDGESTDDKIWYAYELDKNLVLELASPTRLIGIENTINVIFGYAAYEEDVENFRFNHEATDIDPDTSRVVNWQLEIERFIDWAFQARSTIQSRRNFYPWEVGTSSPNNLIFITTVETNAEGEVVERTQTPRWTTGTKVILFTEPGALLPDPLLINTAYYLIRISQTEFQLALSSKNAKNGIAIPLTSSGSGDWFIQEMQNITANPSFELNPFRNNVWVDTPQGIVSDLFNGPFADVRTDELLFDQYRRRLPTNRVLPLRQDLQTRIIIQDGIANDIELDFSSTPDSYNFIHCTAAHIFIDGYEHVVLFNNYASGGELIYDPFVGLNTPKFDVQFDRSPEFTLRPNLGGYVLLNQQDVDFTTSLVRNMEGQTEDLRFAYDTYKALEVNDLVEAGRDSLGYDGPFDFLTAININPKSQFIFWRGLIQAKGSVNSINAFINSRRFIDAKIDEFWAYKIADFGSVGLRQLPEVNLFANDTRSGEIRFHFTETPGTADAGFIEVLPNDQERWYEFPNQTDFFAAAGNMYFNTGIDFIDITESDYIGTGPHYVELPKPADTVVVLYTGSETVSISYTQINSELLEFTGLGSPLPPLRIFMVGPYESKHNPCKIRDVVEETTIAEAILWDPARNYHYHNAIHLVDIQRDTDAAKEYGYEFTLNPETGGFEQNDSSEFDPWGSKEKDTVWLDTNELTFLPYSDTIIFPNVLDRLKQWGRLTDWSLYRLFQWTESDVLPDEYDAVAAVQEGDFTTDPQIRVTGRTRKVTYINSDVENTNWLEYPYERVSFKSKLYFTPADVVFTQPNIVENNPLARDIFGPPGSPFGSPPPGSPPGSPQQVVIGQEIPQFRVYRNGKTYIGASAEQSTGYYYGETVLDAATKFETDMNTASPTVFINEDRIDFIKYQPLSTDVDGNFWLLATPYNTENVIENGVQVTKFYFWVENKAVRQTWRKKELSLQEAAQQLETIPVPYVVPQKLENFVLGGTPPEVIRPRRYTQAILRNYGTIINADDRYVLRFTRDFTLRNDLKDTLDCETTLKTYHQEWKLFRKEQPFNITRYLWNIMTEAIIGQTLNSLSGTAVRIPSLDKELYDVEFNASTRIGIESGQAFCDGEEGWEAILQYLQDGENDFSPIDIRDFFERNDILNLTPRNPDDAQAIADALDEIYNSFTFENINRMFFSVLETAAMPFQRRYEDLFKTSWVALHGIRILETEGLFDD